MALEALERRDCPAAVSVGGMPQVAEAGGTATFTVSLSQRDARPVTVGYFLAGTATFATDYRLASGTTPLAKSGLLTFAPGELTKVIRVTPVNDVAREGVESLSFNLLPPRNATLGTRIATMSIVDDDDYVATIVPDPARPAVPGQSAHFTLSLDKPATQMEQFFLSTSDGSARAGTDYGQLSRAPLVISPGQRTKDFWVPVPQTTSGGTFFVGFEAASPGFPVFAPLDVTIGGPGITPPAASSLIVSDSAISEGNTGTRQAVFTVVRTGPTDGTATVNWATADGSAKVASSDYQAATGSLTFAPGDSVKTVSVTIVGDTTLEPDETYALVLSNAVGATIARASGLGTIRNDEAGFVPQPVPWTILVYMTGENLNKYAFQDINEMEAGLTRMSGGVRIVVSWDQPPASDAKAYATGGGTQAAWRTYGRSVLKADPNQDSIASTFDLSFGERNTGDPATLVDFVKWAALKAPAEHYLLQMWGHGGGLEGSQFDSESAGDPLTISEIRQALGTQGMPAIDVLSYDNCLMGMAEVGYAVSTSVTGQFVASEDSINGTGQDYTTAYQALARAPQTVTPAMLTAGMVTSYGTLYELDPDNLDTFSSVATAGYAQLAKALSQFVATAGAANLTATDLRTLQAAAKASPSYETPWGTQSFVDLGRFMTLTAANVPALRTAATAVTDAITAMVTSKTGDQRNSSGISIYVPTGPDDPYLSSYSRMATAFCTATNWNLFTDWMGQGATQAAARMARVAATGTRADTLLWDRASFWAAYGATQSAGGGDASGSKPRARIAIVPPQAARA